jgi:hypothetical protein
MKKVSVIIMFLCIWGNGIAQTKYPTETEKDLYWQPERKLEFGDYQSIVDTSCVKFNQKYGMQMSSSIGFRGIVDVPKKWKGKIDKGYIVPVFCKNCSCILSEDSMGLKVDRLCFDIAEICARNVRKDLDDFQKAGNIDNPNEMFFTSIRNKWEENMRSFFGEAIREILFDKKEGAYEEWRKTTDERLEQTQEYATKLEDCYRFVIGKPIEKGYKQAKTIMGDMRSKEKLKNEEENKQ